jgi:hypothetical protein
VTAFDFGSCDKADGLAHGFKTKDTFFELCCFVSRRGVFDRGVLRFDGIAVEITCLLAE